MKHLFSIALPLVAASVGWYAFTTMPQQRDILHALRMADKVLVTEYRRGPLEGGYDDLLTQKLLTVPERKELQTAFSSHGLNETPACKFDPHHRVDCVMRDGSTVVIHLCFACNEYAVDKKAHTGLGPWSTALRKTLPRLGVPVRPDKYVKK